MHIAHVCDSVCERRLIVAVFVQQIVHHKHSSRNSAMQLCIKSFIMQTSHQCKEKRKLDLKKSDLLYLDSHRKTCAVNSGSRGEKAARQPLAR